MATRGHYLHHAKKHASHSSSCSTSLLFLSLLCLASLFLVYSLFKSSVFPHNHQNLQFKSSDASETPILVEPCDYSDGMWIYDSNVRSVPYDHTCKEIFKGWDCLASNKSNGLDIIKWRWKPKGCDLPRFDPVRFLERFRNTNVGSLSHLKSKRPLLLLPGKKQGNYSAGFVGDSLNRNMFVSLFCTLKRVSSEVKKWRPAGADRGFTFLQYNFTIAYHRTNLLARYGRFEELGMASSVNIVELEGCPSGWSADANGGKLESLGYKEGFRVDVDIPDGTWVEAPSFHDILIFNTGHWWWAPSKFDPVKSPMLFFENGLPLIPPVPPHVGLDLVLKHMISFVERRMRPGGIKFFRTQSPRHFEGGDWDQGGTCQHLHPLLPEQVEELFSLKNNGTNVETRLVNQHLYKAIKGSDFHILEITKMSEFRADAHPSMAGGKKHDDCMHWCLPGTTDTWNDLFIIHLNNIKFRN